MAHHPHPDPAASDSATRIHPPQRVLILMSNTGGGHRASALALKAGFELYAPGRFTVDIIDLLSDYTFWPLNQAPRVYAWIATTMPWLWGIAYATERSPTLVRNMMRVAGRLAEPRVAAALQQYNPDLVVSVHPLAQEIALHSLRRHSRRIPFATVVTDLAAVHPLWLHPEVDACYLASDETRRQALAAGLPAERVHISGLPIRPAFAEPPPLRNRLRADLGMDAALPAVLVMGGGDGVGPVEEIAVELDAALSAQGAPTGQIVVVCGRNEGLRSRLSARTWSIPHQVLGFVDRMPAWMHASDCIVTKAGPGTMAEAFICGLPIILSGYIPGQERGNIDFVKVQGAGIYIPEPRSIAQTVARWFGPEAEARLRLAQNARALGKPRATEEIVRSLAQLAGHTG